MRSFGFFGNWDRSAEHPALASFARTLAERERLPVIDRTDRSPAALLAGGDLAQSPDLLVTVCGSPLWQRGERQFEPASAADVLTAFRERGERLFEQLGGRFAIAIIDAAAGKIVLAIDPMGIERLVWASDGPAIVFSDSAQAVAQFPAVRASLRPQAVYDYLLLHMIPSPDTAFQGVRKLEPGTCLTFEQGRVTERRYWQPNFRPGAAPSREALEAWLHSALESAVRRTAPDDETGAFLSGGLDSSTVSGMLAKVEGKPARTFSMGFGVDSHDELAFARISAKHFGLRSTEYNVTAEDIVEVFPKIAAAYDEPFGNSSAVPTLLCAQIAARNGIKHLLAGDGGDEIFGGNERYGKQQVFEIWWSLPGWLRTGVLQPLAGSVSPDSAFMPLRKFRSYVDQAKLPMPERLETWNHFYRTPPGDVFEPEFLAGVDPRAPIRHMFEVYGRADSSQLLDRMLNYDWHYTLADNDLRKVGAMCDLAGVRVSYPMLDPEVLAVSLKVPPQMKMEGRELRSFFKRAMRNFLPREILEKQKHGFGLPFGHWLATHTALREMIFDHLTSLARRNIVRRSYLDALLAGHAAGNEGYFGYAIWDLAMLEAWLRAHPAH